MSALVEFWRTASDEMKRHVRQLMSADPELRRQAIDALVNVNCTDAAPVLAERLPDDSPEMTEHLLRSLWKLDPTSAKRVAHAVAAGDDDAQVSAACRVILEQPGESTAEQVKPHGENAFDCQDVMQLIARLSDSDPTVRQQAASQLAVLPDRVVVDAMHRRILSERDPTVVTTTLETLRDINPHNAFEAARALFGKHTNHIWPEIAGKFLVQHGDAGVQILLDAIYQGDGTGDKERGAAIALATCRYVQTMAEAEKHLADPYPWKRARATRVIASVNTASTVEQEAEQRSPFTDGDSARLWTVEGLTQEQVETRASHACHLLTKQLHDSDGRVRMIAIWGLDKLAWPNRFDEAKRLLGDPDEAVRRQAIKTIFDEGRPQYLPDVLKLLGDSSERVRDRALEAAKGWNVSQDMLAAAIAELVRHKEWKKRLIGIEMLGKHGCSDDAWLLRRALRDRDDDVRQAAVETTRRLLDPAGYRKAVLGQLTDKDWHVRRNAVQKLVDCGTPEDVDLILKLVSENRLPMKDAMDTAIHLAPDRKAEIAACILRADDEEAGNAALAVLREEHTDEEVARMASAALPKARGDSGLVLVNAIKDAAPNLLWIAIHDALTSKSGPVRKWAASEITEHLAVDDALEALERLTRDRDSDVRREAYGQLIKFQPKRRFELLQRMAADTSDWEIRQDAAKHLADVEEEWAADLLLPLTRDEDEDVRAEALKAVVRFDDVRVLAELTSSLNDVDEDVQKLAKEIVGGKHGPVPILARVPEGKSAVEAVQKKVDAINLWASRTGYELLGKPVAVVNYRQSLGRTRGRGREAVVEIEVSDAPVTTGHPHGEQIMKGLALHEIGHHIFDIGVRGDLTLRGIARSEGIYDIYHVLTDERLERGLRSRRTEWGVYFDRLASYAFAQHIHAVPLAEFAAIVGRSLVETRTAVEQGELPGRLVAGGDSDDAVKVGLSDGDMLKIPGLLPLHTAFMACLRCGFDPRLCPDPRVAEAVALVPSNLKDLPNNEVLEVARRIAPLIGTTEQYRKQVAAARKRMAAHQRMRRAWEQIVDRLGRMGKAPDWLWKESAGIRRNPVVIYQPPKREARGAPAGWVVNLGKDLDFEPLEHEQTLESDSQRRAELVGSIRRHIRRLRAYLEQLGRRSIEEYASRRGRRLDMGVVGRAVVTRSANLLVHSREETFPSAYIGVLIDCSGSMEGNKIELAKRFGALVAESAQGLRGIAGHVNAFDDDTFYRLGDFQRHAIDQVRAGGGNNDAGALQRAAELALRSGKRHKLLIMISDGSPTECSVDALRHLVQRLTREHEIVCAQAAVAHIDHDCFPRFVDLSRLSMDEAVARFGRLLMELTRSWR